MISILTINTLFRSSIYSYILQFFYILNTNKKDYPYMNSIAKLQDGLLDSSHNNVLFYKKWNIIIIKRTTIIVLIKGNSISNNKWNKIQKKFSWTQIRVFDEIYSYTSLQRADSIMSGKMRSRQASYYGEPTFRVAQYISSFQPTNDFVNKIMHMGFF